MKVGILTWHYYNNVGSNLQAYALQEIIDSMGFDVEIINYRYKRYSDNWVKYIIKNVFIMIDKKFPNIINEKFRFGFLRFQKDKLITSKPIFKKERLKDFSEKYDMVICGSDQIWAPTVFDEIYMLSFVSSPIFKIAYAPSIGLDYIPNELIHKYKELISKIDYISVRESKGVELLKEKCDIESTLVLDPTLLIDRDHWYKLCKHECIIKEPFIFIYLLGDNSIFRGQIIEYISKKNMKAIVLSPKLNNKEISNDISDYYSCMGPTKFLSCISQANIVLTDSFHGMIFSILFHKNFYVFDRFSDGEQENQNSRIDNLTDLLGLSARRIKREDEFNKDINMIDYVSVDRKLECWREKSFEFLQNACFMKGN